MISPSYEQFLENLKRGNLVPVWEEFLADYDTPVSVFKKDRLIRLLFSF